MISKESSNTINYLKCILCIGVVFIHCQFKPLDSQLIGGGQDVDYQSFTEFERLFANLFLDNTCVPLFFLISGFLFFLNKPKGNAIQYFEKKYKSRINSLLVPYIIANFIYIVLGRDYDIHHVLSGFWVVSHNLPADPPLWFLRDLMVCVLLSPVIYYITRDTKFLLPAIMLGCWFFNCWPLNIAGFGIRGFLFFSIGSYLAINEIDIIDKMKDTRVFIMSCLVYFAMLCASYITESDVVLKVSILASFPMWISLASQVSRLSKRECPKVLVIGTFFVFLYHYSYVSGGLTLGLLAITDNTSLPMCFFAYFCGGTLTILVLYSIFLLMRKYTPRIASVIVGGR